ncbi:MAG: Ig-like domain-containing protein [Oscillospiraceae bacterium]
MRPPLRWSTATAGRSPPQSNLSEASQSVTWASSNTAVATVDESGKRHRRGRRHGDDHSYS